MAYDCRVFRILIASPSDVDEERDIAARVIQEWNDVHSFDRGIVLLPLRWETHAAPEYGSRPQDVINRAIVDECDLLLGIFWTRIGTPTGTAGSGTLEEIERVAADGRPVMLYYSKIGANPDDIEVSQLERLREFKKKTREISLTESYRSHVDFRDKLSKQLEMKVRELQQKESTGPPALSLGFASVEDGRQAKLLGNTKQINVQLPVVTDIEIVPEPKRAAIQERIAEQILYLTTFPIYLYIANTGSSGIRNVYLEIDITTPSKRISFSTRRPRDNAIPWRPLGTVVTFSQPDLWQAPEPDPAEIGLRHSDDGWVLAAEWAAIQPQRVLFITPYLFAQAWESGAVQFTAKVFADTFPAPVVLVATLEVEVAQVSTSINSILPDWASEPKQASVYFHDKMPSTVLRS